MAIVDQDLKDRNAIMWVLKEKLEKVQHRMKQQADQHHFKRSFEVRDMVYL